MDAPAIQYSQWVEVQVSVGTEQDVVPVQYELLAWNCFGMLDDQMHHVVKVVFTCQVVLLVEIALLESRKPELTGCCLVTIWTKHADGWP